MKDRFKIVFEKVSELECEGTTGGDSLVADVEALAPHLDELEELRRIVADIADPPAHSYTST